MRLNEYNFLLFRMFSRDKALRFAIADFYLP